MNNEKDKNQGAEALDTDKTVPGRRKLIKSAAAIGGGLALGKSMPDKWHRPLVDAVLLPAHAQTSDVDSGSDRQSGSFGGDIFLTVGTSEETNLFDKDRRRSLASTLVDMVVPPAHAHAGILTVDSGCANLEGNSVEISLSTSEGSLGGQGQLGQEIPLSPNPQGSIRDAFITLTTLTDSNVSPAVVTQMDYDLVFDIVDEDTGVDSTHADAGPRAYGKSGSWDKSC